MPATVLLRSIQIRKTQSQKNFGALRLNLGRAGQFQEVDGKIWDIDHCLAAGRPLPCEGDLLDIDYKEDQYQGKAQWIVRDWRVLDDAARERAMPDFVPPVLIDHDAYARRLDEWIDQVPPTRPCGLILREIYDSAGFREAYFKAPAARTHHQHYPGGLIEHTINVTTLAVALADAYLAGERLTFQGASLPIDRELLIAAGLLHDIGKLDTYRLQPFSEITDTQCWEGHLARSYAIVFSQAQALGDRCAGQAEQDEIGKLLHCILSHHGSLEFGSPVLPACAEAFILAQADITDARLAELVEAGREARAQDPGARWVRGQFHFKNGIFIGDWPEAVRSTPTTDRQKDPAA